MENTTHLWPQGIGVVSNSNMRPNMFILETNNTTNTTTNNNNNKRKLVKPSKEEAVSCPRCNSLNTKFCYYNNYSLSQPRYFCKTCRRYWTHGGSLRNIPVGGGSRKKNTTPSPSPSSNPSILPYYSSKNFTFRNQQNPRLSFPPTEYSAGPSIADNACFGSKDLNFTMMMGTTTNPNNSNLMQDSLLPSMNFPLGGGHADISDGRIVDGGGRFQLGFHQEGETRDRARVLFPVEETKRVEPSNCNSTGDQQIEHKNNEKAGSVTGFWNHRLLMDPWGVRN